MCFRRVLVRVAQQVNDACLGDRRRPGLRDRVGQAFQAVAHHDAHVTHTAVAYLGQHAQPVLGALTAVAGPQAQDVPTAVAGDRESDVDRPVRDLTIADLHVDTVDEDHRVDAVQGPALPLAERVQDPVGDGRDRLLRHLRAIHLGQVRAHLTGGQPLRGQRDHQVVHPTETTLPLRHDRRGERPIPIPGHLHRHRPHIRDQRLGPPAVTRVAVTATLVPAPAQVSVHLTLQRGLQEPLGQLLQQPTLTQQRHPLTPSLLSQTRHRRVVEHLGQQLLTAHGLTPDRASRCAFPSIHHMVSIRSSHLSDFHRLRYTPDPWRIGKIVAASTLILLHTEHDRTT